MELVDASALWRPNLDYCIQSWHPLLKKGVGVGPEEGHEDDQRDGPIKKSKKHMGFFRLEKKRLQRDFIAAFPYLKGAY